MTREFNSSWVCTSVYGPNLRHLKKLFWDEIRACHTDFPWVICGDFNAIFSIEDKISGVPNLGDVQCAQALLSDLNLLEPPLSSRKFTWTKGQIEPAWVSLDHFLVIQDGRPCSKELTNLAFLG